MNRPPDFLPDATGEVSLVPVARVGEFFVTLGKALRASQLYEDNNPVYQRFVQALELAFRGLWEELDELRVTVEEERLTTDGEEVYRNATRSESLAFLFYKDGIRSLVFRPGIEEEARTLLRVLNQARLARSESDDLVTLLWEADLEHLRYRHVDLLAEGLELPEAGPGHTRGELTAVLEAEQEEDASEAGSEATEAPPPTLNQDDFNPTLYALDAREMERVREAIAEETARDIRGDVLNALFDRLEEPNAARQSEVLDVITHLVPALLARGELAAATQLLSELRAIEAREGVMEDVHRRAVAQLLDRLSGEETLGELVQALEDGAMQPRAQLLGAFLGHLRAPALGILLRATETSRSREIQPVLREAVAVIAQRNRQVLLRFLDADDPHVVRGALRLAGRIQVREAAPFLSRLLYHEDASVRRTAVETMHHLKATTLAGTLQEVLLDPDASVRMAAARTLQALRYRGAAARFREILASREIRSADLSEQIAMFEAYGSVDDPQAVPFLDRYLNGKGFLGRREPAEIRACAALGLGKVGSGAARDALRKAIRDDDPVVRNAVGRALRGSEEGVS
ncbi:MAG: HEAT repeat domain-containing protein [Longimicrobiales bacterium]|nr:HEAT repeat domain-containing protein [Longimicrobiales bacterium]